MDIEMRSLGDGGRGLRVVVIAPPLRNGGFAALGAREAPNEPAISAAYSSCTRRG